MIRMLSKLSLQIKPKVTETTASLVIKSLLEVAGDQEHTQVPITEGHPEFAFERRK